MWEPNFKIWETLSNMGIRFLENSTSGTSTVGKGNTLWVKWVYVNPATHTPILISKTGRHAHNHTN